ncbi:unnamed protein product, partial [Rotaria sp. Silwood1]
MMAIEMAGAVYCPLSPQNPDQRLMMLLEQTGTRLVLVHSGTQNRFTGDIVTIDIDAIVNDQHTPNVYDLDRLSLVMVRPEEIAAIVFTSGSTGIPKAIIRFPSNLLKIEYGVTAFGGIMFTSFEMTPKGLCRTNEIHLGSGTNLGNWCVVMPGARLAAKTIVGVYTLVTQETNNCDAGIVLLGIPARKMPF